LRIEATIRDICDRINPKDIVNLTYDLVKIQSPTLHEEELAEKYHDLLNSIGLNTRFQHVEGERKNVIGLLSGEGGGKCLLLGGHLDTIPIGRCIKPRIDGMKVYGRGAEDMKGSLAAMAITAKTLIDSDVKLKGNLILAGWVGHEAPEGRGEGARVLAKQIRSGRIKVDGAVITEGWIDTIMIAQGGMAIFEVKVEGRKGSIHTSLLNLDSNPILWASRVVEELYAMDKRLESCPRHPLIATRPAIQLGIIQGGDLYNRLPENVKITGTIRWDPDEDMKTIEERMKSRLNKVENEIRDKLDSSARIELNMRLIRESYEMSGGEDLVECIRRGSKILFGEDLKVAGMRMVTDLSIIGGEGGIPTLAYGPFRWGKITAHSDNEWIDGERLAKISKILVALAILYCGVEA